MSRLGLHLHLGAILNPVWSWLSSLYPTQRLVSGNKQPLHAIIIEDDLLSCLVVVVAGWYNQKLYDTV